jgi:di/tricarboxylate transporter
MLGSISDVFATTRADQWLAQTVVGAMGGMTANPVLFVLVLSLFCLAISLVLRWPAAAPLITIALAPVATEAGISTLVVGLVALIACNGFFLPYQSTTYLALYHGTGGELFSHAQAWRRQSHTACSPCSHSQRALSFAHDGLLSRAATRERRRLDH